MGRALARLLHGGGMYRAEAVVGRRMSRARGAARFIGGGRPSTRLEDALRSRLVLVAVPDDALSVLNAAPPAVSMKGAAVLHTSGAAGPGALSAWRRRGASLGMLHPMASVPGPGAGLRVLPGACYAVGGGEGAMRQARRIVRCLRGKALRVRPGAAALHHLACVFASNFPVILWEEAFSLSRMAVPRRHLPAHRKALLRLAGTSLHHAAALGPAKALTGPLVRGDLGTLERHMEVLRRRRPSLLPVYRAMSLEALETAVRGGRLTPVQAFRMRKLLSGR